MADFAIYESLSREERLRRIGALFCKAVALSSVRRQNLAASQKVVLSAAVKFIATEGAVVSESLREDEIALIKRFTPLGEFSAREAIEFWKVSRTSAYRRLQRLERAGWIVRRGATNAARYRLTSPEINQHSDQ